MTTNKPEPSREYGNRNHMTFNTVCGVYINELESRLEAAEANLQAIGESEKDLIGVLKQTLLSIPANGNLAVIQIANNAIEYHEALIKESKCS